MTSVDQQPDHDQQERPRPDEVAGASGQARKHARRQARNATHGCTAHAPVLLAAREARSEHGQKLASTSDARSRGQARATTGNGASAQVPDSSVRRARPPESLTAIVVISKVTWGTQAGGEWPETTAATARS
jgi:hypothetical protein